MVALLGNQFDGSLRWCFATVKKSTYAMTSPCWERACLGAVALVLKCRHLGAVLGVAALVAQS